MKLSQWAKKNGLTYQAAYRLFKSGNLPGKVQQLNTGTILIDDNESSNQELKTYIYARVSSHTKKDDLNRQVERCISFCNANGWEIEKVVKEIASGINDKRSNLLNLIDKNPKRIVVEHKDRLTRFGFNYFNHILPLLNYKLVVINKDFEEESDLIKDLIAIITSFCCRLYGLRKGKSKAKSIKEKILTKE